MSSTADTDALDAKIERVEAYFLRTFGKVEASVPLVVGGESRLAWKPLNPTSYEWRIVVINPGGGPDAFGHSVILTKAPLGVRCRVVKYLGALAKELDKAVKQRNADVTEASDMLDHWLADWKVDEVAPPPLGTYVEDGGVILGGVYRTRPPMEPGYEVTVARVEYAKNGHWSSGDDLVYYTRPSATGPLAMRREEFLQKFERSRDQ